MHCNAEICAYIFIYFHMCICKKRLQRGYRSRFTTCPRRAARKRRCNKTPQVKTSKEKFIKNSPASNVHEKELQFGPRQSSWMRPGTEFPTNPKTQETLIPRRSQQNGKAQSRRSDSPIQPTMRAPTQKRRRRDRHYRNSIFYALRCRGLQSHCHSSQRLLKHENELKEKQTDTSTRTSMIETLDVPT